jgi:hypothetical protein
VCAQLHFNIYQEIGAKLDNEHWNKHLKKLVFVECKKKKKKKKEIPVIIGATRTISKSF